MTFFMGSPCFKMRQVMSSEHATQAALIFCVGRGVP